MPRPLARFLFLSASEKSKDRELGSTQGVALDGFFVDKSVELRKSHQTVLMSPMTKGRGIHDPTPPAAKH
jgi:hypothetical protein